MIYALVIVSVLNCISIMILYGALKSNIHPGKKKSPYGIISKYSLNDKKSGYVITKHNKIICDVNNYYDIFWKIEDAIEEMNKFEKLEGYEVTTL